MSTVKNKTENPAKLTLWLAAAPVLLLCLVVISYLLFPFTGIGPENNTFFLTFLILAMISLLLGIFGLWRLHKVNAWLRCLIALGYFPLTLLIALMVGA